MTTISVDADKSDTLKEARTDWGWFVALGVGLIVVGLIASSNLFTSTIASVFYIGVMMLVGAVMQIVHAFTTSGWKQKSISVLGALLYGVASAFIIYDPVLSAIDVTLIVGAFMIAAGIVKIVIGVRERAHKGWGWIVVSGFASLIVGGMVVGTWPLVGLWFLGVVLSFDLIIQGCGFLAFGFSLRNKPS